MAAAPRRLALTPGEPAGIGPDLVLRLAQAGSTEELVACADPRLLGERAAELGTTLRLREADLDAAPRPTAPGTLRVLPVDLAVPARAGRLDPANAGYVLDCLRLAADACRAGRCQALVTGPVHKGVINEAGVAFTGHTEFLAEHLGGYPVMMLVADRLRVALATTHLPLRQVAERIDGALLERVIGILDHDLRVRFRIAAPRILVAGLNPHAGEDGHLGREEIEIMAPALQRLRDRGLRLTGPLPADTLFTPARLAAADAVLAMYHDQGLPVLKYAGFGRAVNVTLGLPIVRTSVDHGTALELAGSGRAEVGSLVQAVAMAARLGAGETGPG